VGGSGCELGNSGDVFLHGLILAHQRLLGFDVGCQSMAADETDVRVRYGMVRYGMVVFV
jgi:hypothetical protein